MTGPAADPAGRLPALPEAVRLRLVELTAQVLPEVAGLPASLRKVAGFAPARRARLGATTIALELERHPDLPERVLTQLRVRHPELTRLVEPPVDLTAAADPVDLAALAWLARPPDWETVYTEALRRIQQRAEATSRQHDAEALARALARVAELERAGEAARTESEQVIADLKRQNAKLRSRLGEARAAERRARAELEQVDLEQADPEQAGSTATDPAVDPGSRAAPASEPVPDAEVRRLRKQVAELRAQLAAARRGARAERAAGTLRARILLDTVVEAATGLRRELALPAADGAPEDRITAEIAAQDPSVSSGAGSLSRTDPALLEQYLAMPRARLIIDGYNLSKATWPSSSLEAQRHLLVSGLAGLVARTGVEATVVFDGADSSARGVGIIPRGVKVLFSPPGVIADDVIRDLVAAEPAGRPIIVVTDDRQIVADVVRAGARAAGVQGLAPLLS